MTTTPSTMKYIDIIEYVWPPFIILCMCIHIYKQFVPVLYTILPREQTGTHICLRSIFVGEIFIKHFWDLYTMAQPFVPTLEECKEWLKNTSINPRTGARITPGKFTYNVLKKATATMLGSTLGTRERCSRRWYRMSDEEGESVGMPGVIHCAQCKGLRRLHAMHDPDDDGGEGTCPRCGSGINLIYVCYYCRHHDDEHHQYEY